MRWLQNYPHFLELSYRFVYNLLGLFVRWLVPDGYTEQIFINLELITKGPVFDCRMCGQCVLHDTGMTCPMTCPKDIRNGPCGGVLMNGNCEILLDTPCIWIQAWERSTQMVDFKENFMQIRPPLNNQLQGKSAWINDLNREIQLQPKGWHP
jgi:hypothetical protein